MRALAVVAPRASAHAGLPNEAHVLIECAGVEAAVERSLADVRTAAERAGATVTEPGPTPWARLRALAGDEDATVVRMGAPPTALAEMLEAARETGCLSWGYAGTGSVLGHAAAGLEAGALSALRARAEARGGFLQIEAGSAELRRRVDPFNLEERELIRSLREQLDPTHTINRGRWMEGL
jgi:FAD/FMN-containing dehydrogenase